MRVQKGIVLQRKDLAAIHAHLIEDHGRLLLTSGKFRPPKWGREASFIGSCAKLKAFIAHLPKSFGVNFLSALTVAQKNNFMPLLNFFADRAWAGWLVCRVRSIVSAGLQQCLLVMCLLRFNEGHVTFVAYVTFCHRRVTHCWRWGLAKLPLLQQGVNKGLYANSVCSSLASVSSKILLP